MHVVLKRSVGIDGKPDFLQTCYALLALICIVKQQHHKTLAWRVSEPVKPNDGCRLEICSLEHFKVEIASLRSQ